MYAIRFPFGDHRASEARVLASGNWRASAPMTNPCPTALIVLPSPLGVPATSFVTVARVLAPTFVVLTEYNTHCPSGDTWGSPTFLTAAKSSNVIGRCTRP